MGPSINYIRIFTCYLDPLLLCYMQYTMEMYLGVLTPTPPPRCVRN